ncbi:MAG: 30S ribosomal protein S17 [Candidatus Andersenbacteria bacterium]|nr:30S ribosomal protein S17 [Candidatus Andersenbacteria bacterium]MBI3251049.1 30S ribosomal protein S17 [Candidatus Andersenbacteria bacterium]
MKKILQGTVKKKSGIKTVAVEVVRHTRHPKYGKSMRRSKIYLAHDETEKAQIGEAVFIQESRPLSARKRWRIIDSKEAKK